MYKVKVYVTLRESVVDPQGTVAKETLQSLQIADVEDVRIGKYIELFVKKGDQIEQKIEEMCEKFLVNTVIEDYRYDIEEVR